MASPSVSLKNTSITADYLWALVSRGRVFIVSDADQNDMVTGQTSFAATTPTFQLDVPDGTWALPIYADLSQGGTVAGGDIGLVVEIDNADRYASSGTSETVLNARTDATHSPLCTFRSNPTAESGYGVRVLSAQIAPDVSPAEGIVPGPLLTMPIPFLLVGPAAWNIYTYAGTTGPTWLWTACWAEGREADLPSVFTS